MFNAQLDPPQQNESLRRLGFNFVIFLCCAVGQMCQPFRCAAWELTAGTGSIALFTSSGWEEAIRQFHRVTGEIWEKRIRRDGPAGCKCERE